jgi:hypothetical protein
MTNYSGMWYPADPLWNMEGVIDCRQRCQPDPVAGSWVPGVKPTNPGFSFCPPSWCSKGELRENYIIPHGDEEADYYNMRGRGPFMVSSTGQKYLRPSLYPVGGPGYFGPMTLRGGSFIPTPDYRYAHRLQKASYKSPLAWTVLQDYMQQYPSLGTTLR